MSETRRLESIKFAQESAKQIITLSTAIVTFIFGVVSVGALTIQGRTFWFMLIALVLLFVSILAGIVTLFALSGILSSRELFASGEPLNSVHYTRFGRAQFFAFVGSVLVISGFILFWPKNDDTRKIEITVPSAISCRTGNAELICKFSKAP
jgi:hypothetical protein